MKIPPDLFVVRMLLFTAGCSFAAEPALIVPASGFPAFFPGHVGLLQ